MEQVKLLRDAVHDVSTMNVNAQTWIYKLTIRLTCN